MAINVTNLPNPVFNNRTLSGLQSTRRMMLLHWSAERYLSIVAGNYGVRRPPIGFSSDDFFRACAQLLMADTKAISGTIWGLLELTFGPYENLVFDLSADASIDDQYLQLGREMEYIGYSATAGTFVHDEVITGGTSNATARFRYLDTTAGKTRLFFVERVGSFQDGETITGVSGATITASGTEKRQVSDSTFPVTDRLPLINAKALIQPGTVDEEEVSLQSLGKFLRRVRLESKLTTAHAAKSVLFVEGGCWELYNTQARRLTVKIKCESKTRGTLPGNSYLHLQGLSTALVRENAAAGATALKLDESVVDGFPAVFPFDMLIDPEGTQQKVFKVSVVSINATTLTFNLSVGLAAAVKKGTQVRWGQTDNTTLTSAAAIAVPPAVQELKAYARYEDVYGTWVLDSAGTGNGPEKVFVTGTTYQRRRLTSPIRVGQTFVTLDSPFETPDGVNLNGRILRVIDSATGLLGTFTVLTALANNKSNRKVSLTAGSLFATAGNLTYVELVETTAGEVTLTCSRPLSNTHIGGTTLQRFYGLQGSTLLSTYGTHVPEAAWYDSQSWSTGGDPVGKFPGPNAFNPEDRTPLNIKASDAATIEAVGRIANSVTTDARAYLFSEVLTEQFDPAQPVVKTIVVTSGSTTYTFELKRIRVSNANYLPTENDVNTFRTDTTRNHNAPFPTRVVIEGEGLQQGQPVYLWGRETLVARPDSQEFVLVSGLQRIHQAGSSIKSYHTEIPLETDTAGVLGVADGFPNTGGVVILDQGSSVPESVEYESLGLETPTRGRIVFKTAFLPEHSHDAFKESNIDSSSVGAPVVRSGKLEESTPRRDGYGFSFLLEGNTGLFRLAFLLAVSRAAGIEIDVVDANDRPIQLPNIKEFI